MYYVYIGVAPWCIDCYLLLNESEPDIKVHGVCSTPPPSFSHPQQWRNSRRPYQQVFLLFPRVQFKVGQK